MRGTFSIRTSIPQFQRNEFGGAIGGPIKKNKIFLFGNYEGFRQHLGLSDVTFVPDNAARAGYIPGANGKLTHVGIAPSAAALLPLWPVQNGPSLGGGIGLAYSNPLQKIREDFGTTRADYNISDRDTLFGVYTVDDSDANTPSANPLSSVIETLREQVASVQEQHVFSPRVLNTARFGFSRAGYFFTGTRRSMCPAGSTGSPIGAVVIGGGTALNGASQISVGGTNAGSNLSAVRNLFTYDDHVAITTGCIRSKQAFGSSAFRRMTIWRNTSTDKLPSVVSRVFCRGTVSTFTVIPSPTPLGWRSLEAAGFVQDAIRPTRSWNCASAFASNQPTAGTKRMDAAPITRFPNGVIATNPRIASSVFTVNRAKFLPEPRFGFSWDPFGKSKLSSMAASASTACCWTILIIASIRRRLSTRRRL